MSRTIRSACASSSARWSVTPEIRECTSPPPSSSAVTTSPVAAFTSGGPPRKIVPWLRTITASSLIAGHVGAAGRAGAEHGGDLRDAARPTSSPGCRRSGRSGRGPGRPRPASGQEGAAGVDQVDARQPVLQGDLLGAQVLLHRHRVVRAALDGGVVGDDHAPRGRPPGRSRRSLRRPAPGRRTSRRRPAAPAPGTAIRGRAGRPPGRAAAACRARCAGPGPSRRRRAAPRPACRAARADSAACAAALAA